MLKNRYRTASLAIVLFFTAAFLGGCGDKEDTSAGLDINLANDPYPEAPEDMPTVLKVLTWDNVIDDEIVRGFQERYGVSLEVTNFNNAEEAWKHIENPEGQWDVMMVNQYMGNRLYKDGRLQDVPRNNEKIYRFIDTSVINPDADPLMKHFIPFDYAALGVSFNINYLAGFPRKWDYLTKDADNPYIYGRVALPDDMRYCFAVGMLYMGIDPLKSTNEDVELVKQMLIANVQKTGLRFMTFPEIEKEMSSNDLLMSVTWSGTASSILQQNKGCRFLLPEGKTIISVDGFVIPRECKTPKASALFIEYMLHPYNSMRIADRSKFASVNKRAMKFVDRFLLNGPSTMIPTRTDMIFVQSLDEETMKIYQKAWHEVKASQINKDKIRIIPLD